MMKETLKKISNIFKKEAKNENYEGYENYGERVIDPIEKKGIYALNKYYGERVIDPLEKKAIDDLNKEWDENCELNRAFCRLTKEEERALNLGKAVSVKTESGEVKKLGWIPMGCFAKLGWVE